MNATTALPQDADRAQAFALALECVTEALWQVPPHTSRAQFEAAVWHLVKLADAKDGARDRALRHARDARICQLLDELSGVRW